MTAFVLPPPICDIYMNAILFLFWLHFLEQRLKCMTKKRVIAVLQCAKLAQCYRQLDRKYYACTLPAADATQFCFLYILTHKLSINEPCILWYRTSCHGFCVCICVKCMRPRCCLYTKNQEFVTSLKPFFSENISP